MTVVDNDHARVIAAVTIATITAPTPTVVCVGSAETATIIGRSPAPVAPIVGIVPTATPTQAPAAHAPTEAEAESTAVTISVPRAVAIPRIKPRVVITHAGRIIVKTVYATGIFAIAIFISVVVVVIPFITVFVFIVATVGILPILFSPFVIIIIRALVVHFLRLGITIIDIIAESYLPRGAARTECE